MKKATTSEDGEAIFSKIRSKRLHTSLRVSSYEPNQTSQELWFAPNIQLTLTFDRAVMRTWEVCGALEKHSQLHQTLWSQCRSPTTLLQLLSYYCPNQSAMLLL